MSCIRRDHTLNVAPPLLLHLAFGGLWSCSPVKGQPNTMVLKILGMHVRDMSHVTDLGTGACRRVPSGVSQPPATAACSRGGAQASTASAQPHTSAWSRHRRKYSERIVSGGMMS